jgi:NAD-dependent dihydropyrimidine dehydrogenase PreA subunit
LGFGFSKKPSVADLSSGKEIIQVGKKVKLHFDLEKCEGCGTCVKVCAIDCWEVVRGKAVFSGEEKCMLCYFCETECPQTVIKLEKIED